MNAVSENVDDKSAVAAGHFHEAANENFPYAHWNLAHLYISCKQYGSALDCLKLAKDLFVTEQHKIVAERVIWKISSKFMSETEPDDGFHKKCLTLVPLLDPLAHDYLQKEWINI